MEPNLRTTETIARIRNLKIAAHLIGDKRYTITEAPSGTYYVTDLQSPDIFVYSAGRFDACLEWIAKLPGGLR